MEPMPDYVFMHLCYTPPMKATHRGIRTTVEIPEELWVAARQRALDERGDLRRLIIEGLKLRLAQKLRKGGAK